MKNSDVRRKNLKDLVSKYRTQEDFAKAAGLDAGYLRQILSGSRAPGPKTTATIEESLSLPEGWMDRIHDDIEGLAIDIERLTKILESMDAIPAHLSAYDKARLIAFGYDQAAEGNAIKFTHNVVKLVLASN